MVLADFAAACGVRSFHYALLLLSQEACVGRVRSRTGHGFTHLDATRQLYAELRDSEIARRHVLAIEDEDAAAVAVVVRHELDSGRLVWP